MHGLELGRACTATTYCTWTQMKGHITSPWRERERDRVSVWICVCVCAPIVHDHQERKKNPRAQTFDSVPECVQCVRVCGLFFQKKKKRKKKIGDET